MTFTLVRELSELTGPPWNDDDAAILVLFVIVVLILVFAIATQP